MIKVIHDNGSVTICENASKIYIEEYEMEKLSIVGSLDPNDRYELVPKRLIRFHPEKTDDSVTFEWDEEKTIEDALVMLKEENQRLRAIAEKHLNELKEEEKKALISYSDAEKAMMLRKIQEAIT